MYQRIPNSIFFETEIATDKKHRYWIRLNVSLESLIPVGDSVPDRVIREPFGIVISFRIKVKNGEGIPSQSDPGGS